MTRSHVSIRSLLACAVLVAAVPFSSACKKSAGDKGLPPATGAGAPPPAKLPAVDDQVPALGERGGGDTTTGTIFAKDEAKIGPKLSGVIAQVFVLENQRVKKGDPLFRIDGRSIALARDQAAAQLRQAQVGLAAVQTEYDRMKGLVEQNAVNRAQWDQVQARLDSAKVAVEQAKIGVAQATQMLGDTVTRAPFDGIVTAKLMNEGEMATMMPPSIVVVVQNQSVLELRVRLPEKALAQIKPGVTLELHFGAVGLERSAEVSRIGAQVDARSRTIEVVAELDNQDGALRPGMLADVAIGPSSGTSPSERPAPAAPAPAAPAPAAPALAAPAPAAPAPAAPAPAAKGATP
jgi:RND family efflux transporter MFP subunit